MKQEHLKFIWYTEHSPQMSHLQWEVKVCQLITFLYIFFALFQYYLYKCNDYEFFQVLFFLFQMWLTHKWTLNFVTVSLLYQSVASTVCPIVACEVTHPNQHDPPATDWFEDIKEELLCLLFLKYIPHWVRWEHRGGGEDSRKREQRYHASSGLIYL